ncbi:MAG: UDP-N-acetylmuramoyl-tripeptide--D-alanyl-D-alanine ligase [Saprospiraceae bacterium]|nr:UDP-N-acetylmuramoyl-tripeptide--D-alanyl-D-alanine ligase [Saprospiraceae bacterium]
MSSIDDLYAIYRKHPVVCTDTRQLTPGCLFFALKGDNFDGNKFAAMALNAGAAYAVVDDPATAASDPRCVFVPDTLLALQQLATHHRKQFFIPIIAIGGSNGKTTTKELVSAVLSSHYPCHFTRGNFNNHIGVPLTLLSMPANTEVAVIEMGTNQPGDIEQLCKIALPTHGLLTNIGKEHLEGFGNLEGVKQAEGELYRHLADHDGCVFVNEAEKYLRSMTRRNKKKIQYGPADTLHPNDSRIDIQCVHENPFLEVAFLSDGDHQRVTVNTRLYGTHNFHNIATAIALGVYFKVPAAKIKAALETYTPANNRSQWLQRGSNTILLDAYNANPSSMRPALDSLKKINAKHKVAILGDMLELGAESEAEHNAMLRYAARVKPDILVLVGPEFGKTPYAKYKALHFPDAVKAKEWFEKQVFEETLILVKGSRGIKVETVLGSLAG